MSQESLTSKNRCTQCNMECEPGEYHTYAACMMYMQCVNPESVRENLAAVVEHGREPPEATGLCPHGMPLAENVCGPCSKGEPNKPSEATGSATQSGATIDVIATIYSYANAIRKLTETWPANEPEPGYQATLYALLVRRGYAQHEAHSLAFDDLLPSIPVEPAPAEATAVQCNCKVKAGMAAFHQDDCPVMADQKEDEYVIDRLSRLLAEIAIALKGPQPAGTLWSYHDLPDMVRKLVSAPVEPREPLLRGTSRCAEIGGHRWSGPFCVMCGEKREWDPSTKDESHGR